MKFLHFCLLPALLAISGSRVSLAQTPTSPLAPTPAYRHYWLAVDLGASTVGSFASGASLHAELSRQWLLTGLYHLETKNGLFSSAGENNTVGLLAGKIFKGPGALVTISAGLGVVRVKTTTTTYSYALFGFPVPLDTSTETQTTVGLPLQVRGYVVALQALGLGLSGTANLNPVRSSASLELSFALGRLPTTRRR